MTDNKDLAEPLFTLKEAAQITGINARTLYRWTVEGRLPFVQPGPGFHIRIRLSDLENLLASKILA